MSTTTFDSAGTRLYTTMSHSATYNSKAQETGDRRMSSANEGIYVPTTVVLRKLPRNTTNEAVRTMLLFAKDLQDTELISNDHPDDTGYVTALARFSSVTSASEAQAMLDGKPNTAGQANMIVEILSSSAIGSGRRNTIDPGATRNVKQPLSPPPQQQKSSRFNGTFQSIEKLSPPLLGSPPDQSTADSNPHMQTIFSPQSPNSHQDRSRITGKSMIGEDAGDDETGELLKDPVAYMKNDGPGYQSASRQSNNSRVPIAGFSALSLNTNMNLPAASGYASPRSAMHSQTPNGTFSPGGHAYQNSANQYLRHNYPPVNPADQNPPCNTLYVGNLPMDTSEDELKAMFSKQRGYKRLCFRTKQNGPMCFVEFEDVSFATKALNELYGVQLHNSVKGGIRLSFSKNPLGVRSGQPGSANPSIPHSPGSNMMNSMSPMSPGSFSTVNGPPPGLSAPPGLNMNGAMSPSTANGQFLTQSFQVGASPLPGHRGMPVSHGYGGQQMNGGYPDHMMGR